MSPRFALTVLAAAGAAPAWRQPAVLTAAAVAQALDLTSFPNSIRAGQSAEQRRRAKTLAQWGFTQVDTAAGALRRVAVYRPDRQWLFQITVLRSTGDTAVVCILDQALNGGTYVTQTSVEVRRGADGLLHATRWHVSEPACGRYPADDPKPAP